MRFFFKYTKGVLFILLWGIAYVGYSQQWSNLQELEKLQTEAVKKKDNSKASYYSLELAKAYIAKSQTDKAEVFLNETVKFGKKAGDTKIQYQGYQHLGQLYTKLKNFSKGLDAYQDALKLAKGTGRADYIIDNSINVAVGYAQLGRHKRSIEPLEEALSLAIQQNNLVLQQRCYELLASYHKELGNEGKYTEYQTLHSSLAEKKTVNAELKQKSEKLKQAQDSLTEVKVSLEEVKEINEKRKLEIELLNKDKELAEMHINEQNAQLEFEAWIRNSVIFGFLMASSLIGVVINSYRRTLRANEKIEKQNKNITSSINYAKRIQEAMLPKVSQQEELIPNSFILFKPRDVVSGDFYWLTEVKSWYNPDVVFAAADCTGHGVPGAFMSMVGINALNGIVNRGVAEVDEILESLDIEIRATLQQDVTGNNDGMDIALCIFRKEKDILEFSGANNPLIYIQNNELFYVKGSVRSIGGHKGKKETAFKKHQIVIDQPTMVYLFSDGYCDQFGDNNKGKFMLKKFKQLLLDIHQLPLEEQREKLNVAFDDWKGTSNQIDDVLVMGVKLEPEV